MTDIDGSCNFHFDEFQLTPPSGMQFSGPQTVEHSTGCPEMTAARITCTMKPEASNPNHLFGGQFFTDPPAQEDSEWRADLYGPTGFTVWFK